MSSRLEHDVPLVDAKNPCYSPAENASMFLSHAASEFSGPPRSRDQYLLSFLARLLYPPGRKQDGFFCWPLKDPNASVVDDLLSHSQSSTATDSSSSREDEDEDPRLHHIHSTSASPNLKVPAKRSASVLNNNGDTDPFYSSLGVGLGLGKRKYASISSDESTYSDLHGSAKRIQSSQNVNMSSFIVLKADPIADFGSPAHTSDESAADSPQVLDLTLASFADAMPTYDMAPPETCIESPWALFPLLRRELPGVGISDRLRNLGYQTVQDVVDALCLDGHLNERILASVAKSDVKRLDLSRSLIKEGSPNIRQRNAMLAVLSLPGNFCLLESLLIDDVPLRNCDLIYIHHMESLSALDLRNTGIGDEAVFHLVALRGTITTLVLCDNFDITDDAVPAIALFDHLSLLQLAGTNVTMVGLRRLASSFHLTIEAGAFGITIPDECQYYLENLRIQYLLSPAPPLITAPVACGSLTLTSLRRNIQAHAAYNPDISTTGSKAQLCERLENLLMLRERDLAVREMMWKSRGAAGDDTYVEEDDD